MNFENTKSRCIQNQHQTLMNRRCTFLDKILLGSIFVIGSKLGIFILLQFIFNLSTIGKQVRRTKSSCMELIQCMHCANKNNNVGLRTIVNEESHWDSFTSHIQSMQAIRSTFEAFFWKHIL